MSLGAWINDTFGGGAEQKAAAAQVAQGQNALNLNQTQYGAAQGYQQPIADIGNRNLNALDQNVNSGAYQQPQSNFQTQPFNYQQSPGYGFQLQQGLGAVQNSAAAQGQGLSGATLKALQRYGTGLAAQDVNQQYQNYLQGNQQNAGIYQQNYSNNLANMTNQYNRQSGLANLGVSANNNLSNLATGFGNTQGDIYGQIGNAQAGGIMGQANATRNTIGNLAKGAVNLATMAINPAAGVAANLGGDLGGHNNDYFNQTRSPYYNQ
jgi:hypothetical protein